MRLESRRRPHADHVTYHYDLVLEAESEEESQLLDLFGEMPDPDGVLSFGRFEIRVSDDCQSHYVRLVAVQS